MTNRLKVVLPEVITDYQSAFVPKRQVTHNVLIAYEINHYIRNRRYGKNGFMTLKLDLRKAYDRVEWTFLESMMLKLGFVAEWVEKIM